MHPKKKIMRGMHASGWTAKCAQDPPYDPNYPAFTTVNDKGVLKNAFRDDMPNKRFFARYN